MLVLLKLRELTWIISKIWIYYVAHNILNIIWLHLIFLESQQIAEPVENTTKLDEVYKSTK